MSPIVITKRDVRVLEWMISKVGEKAIAAACTQLTGNRKPFLFNLAKILCIRIPDELTLTPKSEAQERLKELRNLLNTHTK
jgi:hypothetical protein